MKKLLFRIYKHLKVYRQLPPISVNSYTRMPPFLSLIIRYLSAKYIENKALLKFFPLAFKGTYFEKPLYPQEDGYGYYLQYYGIKSQTTAFLGTPEMAFFKGELLLARRMKANEIHKFNADNNIIFPVSIVNQSVFKVPSINTINDNKYSIELHVNGREHKLHNMAQNRYHYLPLRKGDSVQIKSDYDLLIGKPLQLSQTIKTERKLVLLLFIDNFAAKILEKTPLQELMPNTHKFFSKGHIFNNNYINGHWTLDSAPAFFTGKYPANHGVFHPRWSQDVNKKNNLISGYFQENGYMTFHIGNNQRTAPNYGYANGFDRTVYGRHQPCEEVVTETLEQIRAFPERSQFGLLTFMDMHELINHIPSISSQAQNSLPIHDYLQSSGKGVDIQRNQNYEGRYVSQAKRLDFYLKILFDYIEDNYSNDDILICIVSDHGYLSSGESHKLSQARTSVPFMIRGGGVKQGESDELTENIDIFPTLLHFSKIRYSSKIDGTLPLALGGDVYKKFTYTEGIFPNQPYRAAIRDYDYEFYFESENRVDNQGKVLLDKFKVALLDKETNMDLTKNKYGIVKEYTKVILEHTKNMQKG